MKILVISDTHLTPSLDMTKYWEGLAKFVLKNKPQCIIHLGDVADFDSQNRLIASRGIYSLKEEVRNVKRHLLSFENTIADYNEKARALKHKMYRPLKFLCLGNHENRSDECSNSVRGLFSMFGWAVADYQKPVIIDSIAFAHTFTNGLSDKVCTTAYELLDSCHSSAVCGHSHIKEYVEDCSATHGKIFALKCPMFSTAEPAWAKNLYHKWSRGFTVINTDTSEFVWKDLKCLKKIS